MNISTSQYIPSHAQQKIKRLKDYAVTVFRNLIETEGKNITLSDFLEIIKNKKDNDFLRKNFGINREKYEELTESAREAYDEENIEKYKLFKQKLPVFLASIMSMSATKLKSGEYVLSGKIYIDIDAKDNRNLTQDNILDILFGMFSEHIFLVYPSLSGSGVHCFLYITANTEEELKAAQMYIYEKINNVIKIDTNVNNINRVVILPAFSDFDIENNVYINEDAKPLLIDFSKYKSASEQQRKNTQKNVKYKTHNNNINISDEVAYLEDFCTFIEKTGVISENDERYCDYAERVKLAYTLQHLHAEAAEDYYVRLYNSFDCTEVSEENLRKKYQSFDISRDNNNDFYNAKNMMIYFMKKMRYNIVTEIETEKIHIKKKIYDDKKAVSIIKNRILENQEIALDAKTGTGKTYAIVKIIDEMTSLEKIKISASRDIFEEIENNDIISKDVKFSEDRDSVNVIVTPTSLLAQQIAQEYNIPSLISRTDDIEILNAFENKIIVTNISKFCELFQRCKYKINSVIIDESHNMISHYTRNFKAETISKFYSIIEEYSRKDKDFKIINLSGTHNYSFLSTRDAHVIEIIQDESQNFKFSDVEYSDMTEVVNYIAEKQKNDENAGIEKSENKKICYTNSTSNLAMMKKMLVEVHDYDENNIATIFADVKNNDISDVDYICFDNIKNDSRIPENIEVVLTTSLLTEGVNIKNTDVSEVIYVDDTVTYLTSDVIQAASRIREKNEVNLTIFLHEKRYEKNRENSCQLKEATTVQRTGKSICESRLKRNSIFADELKKIEGSHASKVMTDERENILKDNDFDKMSTIAESQRIYHRYATSTQLINDIEEKDYRFSYVSKESGESGGSGDEHKKIKKEFKKEYDEAIEYHREMIEDDIVKYINAYSFSNADGRIRNKILKNSEKKQIFEVSEDVKFLNSLKKKVRSRYFAQIIEQLHDYSFTLEEIQKMFSIENIDRNKIKNIVTKQLATAIYNKFENERDVVSQIFSKEYIYDIEKELEIINEIEMKRYENMSDIVDDLREKGININVDKLKFIIDKHMITEKHKKYKRKNKNTGRDDYFRPITISRRITLDDVSSIFERKISFENYVNRLLLYV